MIRKILSFAIFTAILTSCGNTSSKEAGSKQEGTANSEKIEFTSLIENPDNYLNKNVTVEGKVVHVCTMTGKKLFIVGENPDVRLFISAGENMPKFPMELLGSTVVVEGTITRVASGAPMGQGEGAMSGGEGMHAMPAGEKTMKADSCETETALAAQASLSDIVMEYKSHIVR